MYLITAQKFSDIVNSHQSMNSRSNLQHYSNVYFTGLQSFMNCYTQTSPQIPRLAVQKSNVHKETSLLILDWFQTNIRCDFHVSLTI